MKNLPLSFLSILGAWERKRWLYNLIWLLDLGLILLIKYLQTDHVPSLLNDLGITIFIAIFFFLNFVYAFTWGINYILYLLHKNLGYWIFKNGAFTTLYIIVNSWCLT
jgi:hypothetical protein